MNPTVNILENDFGVITGLEPVTSVEDYSPAASTN